MSLVNPKNRRQAIKAALRLEQARARIERSVQRELAKELRRFVREASSTYADTGSEVEALLGASAHGFKLADILRKAYRRSVALGRKAVEADANAAGKKDLGGELDRTLENWLRTQAVLRASSISETSAGLISGAIAGGVREGAGARAVGREIAKLTGFTNSRAATIARTETHAAMQDGAFKTASSLLDARRTVKEWVSVSDSRTRDSHRHMDGETVPLDGTFSVNGSTMAHPGDSRGKAGEVINCRCVLIYREEF